MDLMRIQTPAGPRWAIGGSDRPDSRWLPETFRLSDLLALPAGEQAAFLETQAGAPGAEGDLLAPIEADMEVWASGVTYLRSRQAREAEAANADVYTRVYDADRPELFFKANGWRVVAPYGNIRVRRDSRWNVPEPELTLLLNHAGEICGYTAGNDVSSRDIEGENPLYLPQAKVYNGACSLGPVIRLERNAEALRGLPVALEISRGSEVRYQGETSTAKMKRTLTELADYLFRELDFPRGAFLLTGTGLVPPDDFTLATGDEVRITVGELQLTNQVR
jgi:2-dehydro-3-deoxy-D-arabinonate dehydratase